MNWLCVSDATILASTHHTSKILKDINDLYRDIQYENKIGWLVAV